MRPLYAYHYPAFHRTACPWSEWDLVRNGRPWFEGHHQPEAPLWGYLDDAQPATFLLQARAAAAAGIDGFVFDFLWRPGGETLYEETLRNAVLPAAGELPPSFRFGLMWCPIWPRAALPLGMDDPAIDHGAHRLFPFKAEDLLGLLDHVRPYLWHPRAIRVGGRPLLSFFHAWRLVEELGTDGAIAALESLRRRALESGLPGLFLVGCISSAAEADRLAPLGLDAISSYVWWPEWSGPPRQDYRALTAARRADWEELRHKLPVPYLPGVAAGWDATPRGKRDWDQKRIGFPWTPVVEGNTPEAVAEAVAGALSLLDQAGAPADHPVFLASWNEWSEGHRIEPCQRLGEGYLRALAAVRGVTFPSTDVPPRPPRAPPPGTADGGGP